MTYLNDEKNKYFAGDGSRNEEGKSLKEFLEEYDASLYKNPCSTVDTAVFTYKKDSDRLKILLIKRRNHPSIGQWAIPGGFVEFDEDIDFTARRELEEETGLTGIVPVQVKTYGSPDRDPRTRIITTLYAALVEEGSINPMAGDDAAEAELFEINLEEINEDTYKLFLTDSEKGISISVDLKKKIIPGAVVPVVKYEMIGSDGVALDHGVLIAEAYEFIKNVVG